MPVRARADLRYKRSVFKLALVVHWVKVATWAAFLFVFPPVAFAMGMYAGVVVLSVLGLLLDLTELGALLPESTQPKIRRGFVGSVALLHVSLLVASVFHLVFPSYGAWQRIEGTESWNNPSLVRAEHGPLLAVGHGALFSIGKGGVISAVPGIEGPINVLGAGAHRAWLVGVDGEVAWGYDGASVTSVRLGSGFVERTRSGSFRALVGAALDDALFFVLSGALVRVELDGRKSVVIDGAPLHGVATDGTRVVAVGDHVFVSEDGGRRFEEREPLKLAAPSVYAGGGSYYVVQSGHLSAQLFVSEAGGALQKREAPVRDVRILAVDPHDGRRVWLASWGEGAWRSEDGGRSWEDLELKGLEMRALVVDFGRGESARDDSARGDSARDDSARGDSARGDSARGDSARGDSARGEAWVAATNLAIPSGVFHLPRRAVE